MSTVPNAPNASIQPARGFGSLMAFATAADRHAVELQSLAALDVSGHGVAAVRERKEGAGHGNTLFMDLDTGESIEFSDRAAFVAWAAKESLQSNVVATILEVCEAEGALPEAGVLDPSWALNAHEFHVSDTWEDYDPALRATKTRLVEEGMLIDLPLDAPSALRISAQLPSLSEVVASERDGCPQVGLGTLRSAYVFVQEGILQAREPDRNYAATTFGGAKGFACWARALELSSSELEGVNELARRHVHGWAQEEEQERLRQAGFQNKPGAGARLGNLAFTKKETTMNDAAAAGSIETSAKKEKGPSPVLRAVERDRATGEYGTTLVLWPNKGDSKVAFTGTVLGDRVTAFINHQKDGGKPFISLSSEGNGGHVRVGTGNPINAYRDGAPCYFDTIVFNVGEKAIFARVTDAMSDELHKELGFTSTRVERPAKPAPAEAAGVALLEEEQDAAEAPRG